MINNRMISSASVVAKVIADLDLKEDQIRITDIREWIMEGILKIGAVQQYEHKVAILPIECHQVALPCDLYKLGQVAFSFCNGGGWLPMRKATSSFGVFHDRECSNEPCMLIPDTAMFPLVKNMFNLNTDREALEKLNEDTNLRQTLSILLNQWTVGTVMVNLFLEQQIIGMVLCLVMNYNILLNLVILIHVCLEDLLKYPIMLYIPMKTVCQ